MKKQIYILLPLLICLLLIGNIWAQNSPSGKKSDVVPPNVIHLQTKIDQASPDQPGVIEIPALKQSGTSEDAVAIELQKEQSPSAEKLASQPAWEALSGLSPGEQANAVLGLESDERYMTPALHQIEALWNQGDYNAAIEALRDFEEANPGANLRFGLAWKVPPELNAPAWITDVQIATRTSTSQASIDYNDNNGYLYAVFIYADGSNKYWTMNLSTNRGSTWTEKYRWGSSTTLRDVSGVRIGNYFYVGYADGVSGRLRRFGATTGDHDGTYGLKTVVNKGVDVKEIVLTSNEDYYDNSLYYIRTYYLAILENNTLVWFWTDENATTFTEVALNITNASKGLDACVDEGLYFGYTEYFLAFSYVSTTNRLWVVRIKSTSGGTVIEKSEMDDATGETAIAAFRGKTMVVFEHHYTNGTGIKYWVLYEAGSSWKWGTIAEPTTTGGSYYSPDVTARKGKGYGVVYHQEAGTFDPCYYRYREYGTGAGTGFTWTTAVQFNTQDAFTGSKMGIEVMTPSSGYNFTHGMVWTGGTNNNAYFDRTDVLPSAANLTVVTANCNYNYSSPPTLTINLRIINNGNLSAGASYVGYYLSTNDIITPYDTFLGEDYVAGLASSTYSDETITVNVNSYGLAAGNYYVGFILDYKDDVDETPYENDNNWYFAAPITIPAGETMAVASPNGGENWERGSSHAITWTSTGTSGTVKIEISRDNGATWSTITASTTDDHTYTWTVTGPASTNCRVRISDTDGSISDVSNAVFTISEPPNIHVNIPNGGERYPVNSSQTITWSSSGTSGTVKIEISHNNGGAWTLLTASTADDGSSARVLPGPASTNCLIRITDVDGSPSDVSDATFILFDPYLTVTAPNGGENWQIGTTKNITWNSDGNSGNVLIELSRNNGTTWETLFASTPDDYTQAWAVAGAASTTCLMRISDVDGTPSDVSNAPFTISTVPVPDIDVNPMTWNYGDVNVGASSDKSFTITNTGTANLSVTATTLGGTNPAEFSIQSGGAPFTLAPAGTRTLVVRFAPTSINNKSATLTINSNDPDENPVIVNLNGKGVTVTTGWECALNITGGTWSYVRTFGGAATATDGYDVGVDLPAAPPGMTYYAFFQLPVFPTYLDKDIRQWSAPYELVLEWTLILTNASAVMTQLTWNPAQLPAGGTFMLTGSGLNVNMREVNNASVSGNATLIIRYQKVTVVTVPYAFSRAGWYLISLPVTPADNRLNVLFPTALGAYGYNPATGSYVPAMNLDPKKGYWLLIPGAASVNISGEPLLTFTEHYTAGWHLIGSSYGTSLPIADPDDAPNGAVIAIYGWNPATNSYVPVYPPGSGVLNQGEGYWMAAVAGCDLTIPGAPPLAKDVETVNADLPQFYQQYGMQPPQPPFIQNEALPLLTPIQNEISYNYPNPFNPATTIKYTLSKTSFTGVYVYNSIGQRIRTLSEATQPIGIYEVVWDGRNELGELVPSGIYFYQITTADFVETKKMMLLK
ncbi:choice-of-anchor D domain-containing protein [candidate division KSB1 bacterium]|nr:choice-of-anchor D domain-containing protein [candidate division KSB1 bacterium]